MVDEGANDDVGAECGTFGPFLRVMTESKNYSCHGYAVH